MLHIVPWQLTCNRGEVYSHQQGEVGGNVVDVVGLSDVIGRFWGWNRRLVFLLNEHTSMTIFPPQVL